MANGIIRIKEKVNLISEIRRDSDGIGKQSDFNYRGIERDW